MVRCHSRGPVYPGTPWRSQFLRVRLSRRHSHIRPRRPGNVGVGRTGGFDQSMQRRMERGLSRGCSRPGSPVGSPWPAAMDSRRSRSPGASLVDLSRTYSPPRHRRRHSSACSEVFGMRAASHRSTPHQYQTSSRSRTDRGDSTDDLSSGLYECVPLMTDAMRHGNGLEWGHALFVRSIHGSTHKAWRKGLIMIDPQMLQALSRFDPLPEDVKRRMVRLDDGDEVLNPFREERTGDRIGDSRRPSHSQGRS